jgi:hypothetical protein
LQPARYPATDAKATVKTEATVNTDAVKPAMPAKRRRRRKDDR